MKKEEILFLNELVKTLEKSELKLEEYYNRKEYENFNNAKNFMIIVY